MADVGGASYPSALPGYPDPTANPAAYGSIPNIPNPVATVPTSTAIAAGTAVNQQLPGYGAALGNVGANIQSETAGQLPQDVVNQIEQQAAERGVATGSPGSPNANAAMLRALGLNSLSLTQQGQGNLQSILQSLPGESLVANPQFYPSSGQQQQAQELQATYAAAPKPQAAAAAGMAAANKGVAAGLGSVPSVAPPNYPTSWGAPATGYTTPIPLAVGSGVNPGGQPLNTAGTDQQTIDQIIAGLPGYQGGTQYPGAIGPDYLPTEQEFADQTGFGQLPPDDYSFNPGEGADTSGGG